MKKIFKDNNTQFEIEAWLDMKDVSGKLVDLFYDLLDKGYARDQVQYLFMEAYKTVDTFDTMLQEGREKTRRLIQNMEHGDEGKMEVVEGKF
jgi:hypothetical protein